MRAMPRRHAPRGQRGPARTRSVHRISGRPLLLLLVFVLRQRGLACGRRAAGEGVGGAGTVHLCLGPCRPHSGQMRLCDACSVPSLPPPGPPRPPHTAPGLQGGGPQTGGKPKPRSLLLLDMRRRRVPRPAASCWSAGSLMFKRYFCKAGRVGQKKEL